MAVWLTCVTFETVEAMNNLEIDNMRTSPSALIGLNGRKLRQPSVAGVVSLLV